METLNLFTLLKTLEEKKITQKEINKKLNAYLNMRIHSHLYLKNDEMRECQKLSNYVKINVLNMEVKEKICIKLAELVIISNDNKRKTNIYEEYLSCKESSKELDAQEKFLNKVNILLQNTSGIVSIDSIIMQANIFESLDFTNKFIELLKNNNFSKYLCSEQKAVNHYIRTNENGGKQFNMLLKKLESKVYKGEYTINTITTFLKDIDALINLGYNNINFSKFKKLVLPLTKSASFLKKVSSIEEIKQVKKQIDDIVLNIENNLGLDEKFKNLFLTDVSKVFITPPNLNLYTKLDKLPYYDENDIITIDPSKTKNKDGAFAIKKVDNCYIFDIFVADIPCYLEGNSKLSDFAYQMGRDFFFNHRQSIRMLPNNLGKKILSLDKGILRNAITFRFRFTNDGKMESYEISRKKIDVKYSLFYNINNDLVDDNGNIVKNKKLMMDKKLQEQLILYDELLEKYKSNTKYSHIKEISNSSFASKMAFPSLLINHLIGSEANFAIYCNNNKYSKEKDEYQHTQSSTPIRNFVSNINLAFFLEQNNVYSFKRKHLSSIEKNIDEIINHLNERNYLQMYIGKYDIFVKKFI